MSRVIAVVFLALVATGCSGNGDAGPTAKPDAVVANAPQITMALGNAHVVGAAPGVTASGRVDFVTGADTLTVAGLKKDAAPFGVTEPAAMIDLLRGVVDVKAYGGAEVQGEGTKRYEVDINLPKAIAATPPTRRADLQKLNGVVGADEKLWADVFIDKSGRVRRILIPVHTASNRPYGEDQTEPQEVSVDYSNFGSAR
ncbi:MAG TPA: hypothetical protein VHD87_05590 [Acidimicrobiales bacterium]|nr:hypothetical protein [Acidimicrobiales bacterium]